MSKIPVPDPRSPEQILRRIRKKINKKANTEKNYDRAMEIFNGEKKESGK